MFSIASSIFILKLPFYHLLTATEQEPWQQRKWASGLKMKPQLAFVCLFVLLMSLSSLIGIDVCLVLHLGLLNKQPNKHPPGERRKTISLEAKKAKLGTMSSLKKKLLTVNFNGFRCLQMWSFFFISNFDINCLPLAYKHSYQSKIATLYICAAASPAVNQTHTLVIPLRGLEECVSSKTSVFSFIFWKIKSNSKFPNRFDKEFD